MSGIRYILANTENKPVALVLGGTVPHITLIEKLKSRGYYTVLIDYYEAPPAKAAADSHIRESTLDPDKVLEIAKDTKAALVISTSIDQANVTACYVGEKLKLPIPYSYETALAVTNKGLMKQRMIRAGITTSNYVHVNNKSTVEISKLKYPVMVKPADSCASAGVKKASSPEDLKLFLNQALNISRAGEAVIEEFVSGREISIYSFVQDQHVHIIMMSERHSVIDGENEVLKCYATTTPPRLSPEALKKIQENGNRIAKEFQLNNTPLHIQVLVDGDKINVIEFAPRAGGGVSHQTIKSNTGFDIIDATIDSFLGIRVDPKFKPSARYYSINILYANAGIFDRITGYREILDNQLVEEFYLYKSKGTEIKTDKAGASRIGSFILSADSEKELSDKAKMILDKIDVLDSDGKSLLRKDLFFHV